MSTTTEKPETDKKNINLTLAQLDAQSMSNPEYAHLVSVCLESLTLDEALLKSKYDNAQYKELEKDYGLKERAQIIQLAFGPTPISLYEMSKHLKLDYMLVLARYESVGSNVEKILTDFDVKVWSYHQKWYDKKGLEKETKLKVSEIFCDNPKTKNAATIKDLILRTCAVAYGTDSI